MTGEARAAVSARIGYVFGDRQLVLRALTHPSYALEHGGDDFQRLEFLGDSVLSFIVATYLYETFPDLPEGVLTRMKVSLTSGHTLSQVARSLDLGPALLLGRGAVREADRDSVLEDALEAVIGAVHIDGGLDAARAVILTCLGPRLDPAALMSTTLDPKTELQELTQSRGLGLPKYEIVAQSGPAHEPHFRAVVRVDGQLAGTGEGTSKQTAQQAAAADALTTL